jgi:hypothetical protein
MGTTAIGYSTSGGNPFRIRSTTTKTGAPYIELAEWATNPYTDANWTPLTTLDAQGLTILGSTTVTDYSAYNAVSFVDGSDNLLGGLVGGFLSTILSYLRLKAIGPSSGNDAEIRMIGAATTPSQIIMLADAIGHTIDGTSAYLRVPLKTPLLNSAYNGDDTITTASGETTLDAQDWGVPSNATEISVRVRCKFNGASNANLLEFYPTSTTRGYVMLYEPNDAQWTSGSGTIPLNLSGQFYAKATGNNATNVDIIVTGYAI